MQTFAIATAVLIASQVVSGRAVYDDYDAYYRANAGIFREAASLRIDGARNAVVHWRNQRVELKEAKPFPREFSVNDDVGSDAISFESFPYACIEGQSASASGTAIRHTSVYLLDARGAGKVRTYKLPSLFAACSEVRLDREGQPLFFAAAYIFADGFDNAIGTSLREYVISRGEFVPTGHAVTTRFVEPENVWKFEVEAEQ